MVGNALALADRDRLHLFDRLGEPRRLDLTSRFWVDGEGIPWSGMKAGRVGLGLTSLGPGWVFDPLARRIRHEEFQARIRAVRAADEDQSRQELGRIARSLRLG